MPIPPQIPAHHLLVVLVEVVRSPGEVGYCSRADGPANITKNSKYWNADTYCWTCGYDCSSRNHDRNTCDHKAAGHQDAATGANPIGGSTKDKEYSK